MVTDNCMGQLCIHHDCNKSVPSRLSLETCNLDSCYIWIYCIRTHTPIHILHTSLLQMEIGLEQTSLLGNPGNNLNNIHSDHWYLLALCQLFITMEHEIYTLAKICPPNFWLCIYHSRIVYSVFKSYKRDEVSTFCITWRPWVA